MPDVLRKWICRQCGLAFEEENRDKDFQNGACPRCGEQMKAPTSLAGGGEPTR
jgi:rubrerythrin